MLVLHQCVYAAEGQALAVKIGCVELLVVALKTHSRDANVTTAACATLRNITCDNGWQRAQCLLMSVCGGTLVLTSWLHHTFVVMKQFRQCRSDHCSQPASC